jgi:hypothetical protein
VAGSPPAKVTWGTFPPAFFCFSQLLDLEKEYSRGLKRHFATEVLVSTLMISAFCGVDIGGSPD